MYGILDPKGLQLNPLTGKAYSDKYKQLAKAWTELPAYQKAQEIIRIINGIDGIDGVNGIDIVDVLLIISGTGSGKTVLVPKFALHAMDYGKKGKIALTFPKKIITVSSAQYAANTLDVELGAEIGYIHKDAPKGSYSDKTKMLYMTDGSLVSIITRDPLLSEYGCVIIDEAHERKTQIDLLLLLLRRIIPIRRDAGKPLKLIIMSATINPATFMDYFSKKCTVQKMEISGKPNFPIKMVYPPTSSFDYISAGIQIIKNILKQHTKGDILFFVTSGAEASKVCKKLTDQGINEMCIEVFSEMSLEKKQLLVKPHNGVKIYIATNVAESSITLDGVTHIIDSGLELFSFYDSEKMAHTLKKQFITQAQAGQRAGRVGRTEPGTCYRLYTEEQFKKMQAYPVPDILRADLTSEFIKLFSYVEDTKGSQSSFSALMELLKELLDTPSKEMIDCAYNLYKTLQLLDKDDNLTILGKQVGSFSSLAVGTAVALILSYAHHCAYDFSLLVALMEHFNYDIMRLFFQNKKDYEKNVKTLKELADTTGDHMTILKIFKEAESGQLPYCKKYGLNHYSVLDKSIRDKARRYFSTLQRLLPNVKTGGGEDLNKKEVLKCLAIGLQSNIAKKSNGYYRTIYPAVSTQVQLTKQTSLSDAPSMCVYQELFIMDDGAEISFVSKITPELIKELDN